MLGAEAARTLNRNFLGPTVHRRGTNTHGMFVDCHVRVKQDVIMEGNMCPVYLNNLGHELSLLDREIFDEFLTKIMGETNVLSPQGRSFGSCPMLMTGINCPDLFTQVRQTTLFSITRNYMCKCDLLNMDMTNSVPPFFFKNTNNDNLLLVHRNIQK